MTRTEILSLNQVAEAAAQRLVEITQSQKDGVEVARAAAVKLRDEAEKILIDAQNALASLAEGADRESAEAVLAEAERAFKEAGKQADMDVTAAVFGSEKLIAVATTAVAEADQAVVVARAVLIDEQKVQALHLIRYARRYAPGDAATAEQILATFEPEAVAAGKSKFVVEQESLDAKLRDAGTTPLAAPASAPRSSVRKRKSG